MRSYPIRSAMTGLPHVAELQSCQHDAVQVVRERRWLTMAAPVTTDAQESLPARTVGISDARDIRLDPVFIGKFHDATLLDDRNVITADGYLVPEFCGQAALHRRHPRWTEEANGAFVTLPQHPEPVNIPGISVAFFFSPASGTNHSHFLVQTLPQLSYLDKAGITYDRVVVMPTIREYQYDILEVLGCPREKVAIRPQEQAWHFETLYVCYVSGDLMPDRDHIDRLKTHFGRLESAPRRLYIARLDARDVRRFLNEDEVIARLEKRGFRTILPSTLSAADEVRLFRDARVIVGPLGAGLYNALFTDPGGILLGMSDPNYIMPWLPQTAAVSQLDYGWSFGVCFHSNEPLYRGTHNNWLTDPNRVASLVDDLVARYDPT